jgi:hypothetical protein
LLCIKAIGVNLALLLLILARDKAVGPPDENGHPQSQLRFFDFASFSSKYLFRQSATSALGTLQQEFPFARMHFNHFVKLHDFKSINRESLLLLMTRGAGVLCANSQAKIDAVTPFLKSGTKLSVDNLGLILYQMKNDSDYNTQPKTEAFRRYRSLRP